MEKFFELKNRSVSPIFRFSGIKWYISFYSKMPRRLKFNFSKYLSIFLHCSDLKKPIVLKADLTLLNQTTGHKNKVRSFDHEFTRTTQGFGWPLFINYDKLKENGFIRNDKIIFQFSLWTL